MEGIPTSVHEGMKVYDSAMHAIGTVETFRASDEDPNEPGPETAGVDPVVARDDESLAAIFADLFRPGDGLPREMQEKAYREGFIRLDAEGLFAADRYVFPEQIDRVEGDKVVLNVEKSSLLKA